MKTEKKTLVTSESELKVGNLIEVRDCQSCSKVHRGMILNITSGPPQVSHGGELVANKADRAYVMLPNWHRKIMVFDRAISAQRLYKIETGLESHEETTAGKVLEKTK